MTNVKKIRILSIQRSKDFKKILIFQGCITGNF